MNRNDAQRPPTYNSTLRTRRIELVLYRNDKKGHMSINEFKALDGISLTELRLITFGSYMVEKRCINIRFTYQTLINEK